MDPTRQKGGFRKRHSVRSGAQNCETNLQKKLNEAQTSKTTVEESPTGVNAFPDSPDGVEGFPQSPQQQQELQNAPTSPTPLTPQPSPVNLGEDFADEVDTPDIPRFQIRGGIEDNDTDEEEEIVRQQDAQDAIQRFIPMEMPEIVKETLEKLFYDEQ